MNPALLVEILTEELPPHLLKKMESAFASNLFDGLVKLGFVKQETVFKSFSTPRRLAVLVPDVLAIQPDQQIQKKGPAVSISFKEGQPTPALLGFARSIGKEDQLDELETIVEDGQAFFIFRTVKRGEMLSSILPHALESVLKKLPAPKMMHWGEWETLFIRPIHGFVLLHGQTVIEAALFHLRSGRTTRGHRFLGKKEIIIGHADHYASQLGDEGYVIAHFHERYRLIQSLLDAKANALHAQIAPCPGLLDEVTALVEWPVVYVGEFSADFLSLPAECLILTMQQQQRYFSLLDQDGVLLPRFLMVANVETSDPAQIIEGNERVLRARLSDAQFFFEQDRKHRLEDRVQALAEVVYHYKIGSQLERVYRLQQIAVEIGLSIGADSIPTERAAYLSKADLLTNMVGEFPQLQGVMGKHYARHDGEMEAVAIAIESHYYPRFAGDALPTHPVAIAVALADKLEMILGIYGIGLIPTGDKDPFGLRRAALGILRMMLNLPLDLKVLLEKVARTFPSGTIAEGTVDRVYHFILERLKHYLISDYQPNDVDAVLARYPTRFNDILARLQAVSTFRTLPESTSLAIANKRIRHILKKANVSLGPIDTRLFVQDAEVGLYTAYAELAPRVEQLLESGDFTNILTRLATLKVPIDLFFDSVMVLDEDLDIRANRLSFLSVLAEFMNCVAELSLLVG